MGPKVEREVPVSIHDVRLVVPYETRQRVRVLVNGKWEHPFATVYRDVVVDHIEMERHTTGIDPFTGTDYGDAEIPKDHQYDPETGLPIFHRYIAGTRHRIEWPWEHKEGDKLQDRSVAEGGEADKQTIFRKTLNTLRHPISSIKQLTSSTSKTFKTSKASDATTTEAVEAEAKRRRSRLAKEITMMEDKSQRVRNTIKPKSKDPRHRHAVDNTDTTRNIVEGAESMSYKLVSPPFPDTLFDELRSDIQDFAATSRKDETAPLGKRPKRATEQGILAREASRAKHAAAMKMKTPMQLRWEMEQAKKVKLQKTSPLVSTEELMIALGKHIQQGKAKKASRDEEAD
jgi:large subunit ribosomal protein L24